MGLSCICSISRSLRVASVLRSERCCMWLLSRVRKLMLGVFLSCSRSLPVRLYEGMCTGYRTVLIL